MTDATLAESPQDRLEKLLNLYSGSQFAAAKGGEGVLFGLAYELEKAQPWAGRMPAEFVG